MPRHNSSEDEIRPLERELEAGLLDLAGQARLLGLYQRAKGGVEGVLEFFDKAFFDADIRPVWATRMRTLRVVHAAGFSHPDPEVILLLTPWERRLAVFVASMNFLDLGLRFGRRFGFDSEHRAKLDSRIVHGDIKAGSHHYGDERIETPSNRGDYQGEAGLAKALSEAADYESDFAPIVLLQRHPWGEPSETGYKRWFVENSLFIGPGNTGALDGIYFLRYLHFVGEHALRPSEDPGVIELDYRTRDAPSYQLRLSALDAPSDQLRLSGHGVIQEAHLHSRVARFEIGMLDLINRKGARGVSLRGGSGASWQDVAATLTALLQHDGTRTDFLLQPTHAATAAWRGSRRFADPVAPFGFVLGVQTAVGREDPGPITIGIGSNQLERRQTAIRPDLVWPELAPWPGKSVGKLTRRLEDWSGRLDDSKIQIDRETAVAWLAVLDDPIAYSTGEYP